MDLTTPDIFTEPSTGGISTPFTEIDYTSDLNPAACINASWTVVHPL